MAKIKFIQDWTGSYTHCPFHNNDLMVGDYNCSTCRHFASIHKDEIDCIHPKIRDLREIPTKFMKYHVNVISHTIDGKQVEEQHFYMLNKKEAIKKFLETHKNVMRSKDNCKAFYEYEIKDENRLRNRKYSRASIAQAQRNKL